VDAVLDSELLDSVGLCDVVWVGGARREDAVCNGGCGTIGLEAVGAGEGGENVTGNKGDVNCAGGFVRRWVCYDGLVKHTTSGMPIQVD
jgi:hypothetical protein